jgi:Flp pilus assembly protein TadG
MTPTIVLETLRKSARKFRRAKGGNVMMTFALSLLPMIGFVGAAVDYSRGNSAKAAMQQAIDATGLMLSKDAPTMLQSELNQKADGLFKTLINRPEIENIVVTPTLTNPEEGTFKLAVNVTGMIQTAFMKLFGKDQLDLNASAEIKWGIKKLELALVLDNTGSMGSSNKMTELKKALLNVQGQGGATADGLLETLKKASKQAGDVRISVIPFDIAINIGTSYKSETWLNWTKEYGTCSSSSYVTKADCQAHSKTWTTSNNKNNWTGCVLDRDQSNDVNDTAPNTGVTSTLFPTTLYSSCSGLVQALPLTDIWNTGYQTIHDKINSMQPNKNTNVTIGLAWGWHSLTSNLPFPEGTDPKPDIDKVIILLTDGDNTQDRWYTDQASIDLRTQTACSNAKAANIKVYTIRVIDGNSALLKSCATKPEMYFEVSQANQLTPVFSAIAQQLANLRIAK